jgi:hypothetical protein
MTYAPELLLLPYALSRARMWSGPGPRPARRVAMSARHQYARQLANR